MKCFELIFTRKRLVCWVSYLRRRGRAKQRFLGSCCTFMLGGRRATGLWCRPPTSYTPAAHSLPTAPATERPDDPRDPQNPQRNQINTHMCSQTIAKFRTYQNAWNVFAMEKRFVSWKEVLLYFVTGLEIKWWYFHDVIEIISRDDALKKMT
jgi:hypothetical protein